MMRNNCLVRQRWVAVAGGLALALAVAVRADVTPSADHSLSTAEYLSLRLPPIDKPWGFDDYKEAIAPLTRISLENSSQLPRFKSPKSGETFARFIAPENLSRFTDPKIPVDERVKNFADDGTTEDGVHWYLRLLNVYRVINSPEKSFDTEMLELSGYALQMELVMAKTADEYAVAHPEKKVDPATVQGFNQLRDGISDGIEAVLGMMLDISTRPSEAVRFIGEFKVYFPQLIDQLQPGGKAHITIVLKRDVAAATDKDLKAAMGDLLTLIK